MRAWICNYRFALVCCTAFIALSGVATATELPESSSSEMAEIEGATPPDSSAPTELPAPPAESENIPDIEVTGPSENASPNAVDLEPDPALVQQDPQLPSELLVKPPLVSAESTLGQIAHTLNGGVLEAPWYGFSIDDVRPYFWWGPGGDVQVTGLKPMPFEEAGQVTGFAMTISGIW